MGWPIVLAEHDCSETRSRNLGFYLRFSCSQRNLLFIRNCVRNRIFSPPVSNVEWVLFSWRRLRFVYMPSPPVLPYFLKVLIIGLILFILSALGAYFVARNVLGHFGEILYLLIIIIGIVTTVCAEIIAISSIFVFDIYKTYIFVRIFNTSSFLCNVLLIWDPFLASQAQS